MNTIIKSSITKLTAPIPVIVNSLYKNDTLIRETRIYDNPNNMYIVHRYYFNDKVYEKRETFKNNRIKLRIKCIDNKFNGKIATYQSGILDTYTSYKNDKAEGPCLINYNKDGVTIKLKGNFRDGIKSGIFSSANEKEYCVYFYNDQEVTKEDYINKGLALSIAISLL
jgi:hypothetical protein